MITINKKRYLRNESPVQARNSIIADNAYCDCAGADWTENVGNLSTDRNCSTAVTTNNPELERLMAMSPPYYPLQPESPAVDGGSLDQCLGSDQRDMRPPQSDACDIGA